MTTFTPPTTTESSDDYFFGRYKVPVGISVVWNGTTFVNQAYPWLGDLVNLTEGVTWFQGGRTYEVSSATADALTTAGYTVGDFELQPWFNALRNRATAPAKVLVIGDSISEGAVAGGYTLRWQTLLQSQLRSRLPDNAGSGIGYVPALTVPVSPGPPVTLGGSPGASYSTEGLGVKRYRVNNTGPAFVQWDAQNCDAVRVHWAKTNFLAGSGTISIDGVDQVTLNSSDANTIDGQVWDSGPLTPGSHVVKVRGASGFGFPITACEFFNADQNSGLRVYDGAHYGSQTATFLTASADTGHWLVVARIQPQVCVVNLGTNEVSESVDTYRANIAAVAAKIQTASPGCVVVLVKGYRAGATSQIVWDSFHAALDSVAATTDGVTTFDLAAQWPPLTPDGLNNGGLMYEGVNPIHPNTAGHQRYADLMTELLCPTGLAL